MDDEELERVTEVFVAEMPDLRDRLGMATESRFLL